MNRTLILCTVAACGFLLASCNKDDDSALAQDSSTTASGLSYQLRTINEVVNVNSVDPSDGVLRWTSGFANPREIKFEARRGGNNGNGNGNGNGNKIEYKTKNASQIDLFAPVSTLFGTLALPPGTYREIEMKMKFDKNGDAPALQLGGEYIPSPLAPAVPVLLQVNDAKEIKTEVEDVTIDEFSTFNATTILDLAGLTDGITPAMFQNAQRTNGVILISPASNQDLYDIMVRNLRDKRHGCEVKKNK